MGGCLCGALRYQIDNSQPIGSGYCHCRACQLSAGAPVLVWATFSTHAFAYTQGMPSVYQSSVRYQREFCGKCGTQIAFRTIEQATTIDITVMSLDNPSIYQPEYHIWTKSQVIWFDIQDRLQRYQASGPDI